MEFTIVLIMGTCLLLFIIITVIFLFITQRNRINFEERLAQSRKEYQKALSELKSDPTNSNLRQKTLQLGREYSNVTRENRGVTIYDEVALMNDINAACAGAQLKYHSTPNLEKTTLEKRLENLSDLKTKGLISEQEFIEKRKKILDEI